MVGCGQLLKRDKESIGMEPLDVPTRNKSFDAKGDEIHVGDHVSDGIRAGTVLRITSTGEQLVFAFEYGLGKLGADANCKEKVAKTGNLILIPKRQWERAVGTMTIEQKKEIEREFEKVKQMLDDKGIPYEVHRPFISFMDMTGNECTVFPSQSYDDKLVVSYRRKKRVDSAEEALRACGVIE